MENISLWVLVVDKMIEIFPTIYRFLAMGVYKNINICYKNCQLLTTSPEQTAPFFR